MVICYHAKTDGHRILAEARFNDCHAIKLRSAAATSVTPGMLLTTDWPRLRELNLPPRRATQVLERDGHQREEQSEIA
jgi:hypothetical protein